MDADLEGEEGDVGNQFASGDKLNLELPDFKDYSMRGRTYRYMQQEPLYPFGYGLSYTTFTYGGAGLSKSRLDHDGVVASADVTNAGKVDGYETVQIYVKAPAADAPNRQLKGIRKVFLKAGETKHVEIPLSIEAFSLYDEEAVRRVAKGSFQISIGGSQPKPRSEALTGQKVPVLTLENSGELVL